MNSYISPQWAIRWAIYLWPVPAHGNVCYLSIILQHGSWCTSSHACITALCPRRSQTTWRIWSSCVKAPAPPSPRPVRTSRIFCPPKGRSLSVLSNQNALLMVRNVFHPLCISLLYFFLSLSVSQSLPTYIIFIFTHLCGQRLSCTH